MILDRLRRTLIAQEGLQLKPYTCPAGKLSIGVGRNLEDVGISRGEAMYLLECDIASCFETAHKQWPWFKDLDSVRQEVILNMLFNLGLPRLKSFKKFLGHVGSKEYAHASVEMLDSQWAKQVGVRATYLAEAMKTGRFDRVD